MAAVFEGVQSASGIGTLTITKPTGLAVGDILVASVFGGGGGDVSTPSGWTSLITVDTDYDVYRARCFTKTADASDVAAANFAFSNSYGGFCYGFLSRLSGAAYDKITTYNRSNSATSSVSYTGVTPAYADSLFIIVSAFGNGGGSSPYFSSYAMATSNPTWTEQVEYDNGGGFASSIASSTRSASTATGNISLSISGLGANSDVYSYLLVFLPTANVATTPTTVDLVSTIPPTLFPISITSAVPAVTVVQENGIWTNDTQTATPTWVNDTQS